MADQRLKGQEVSIRVVNAGATVDSIDAIGSFNDAFAAEIKEAGFLGEFTNRFDSVLNGYGGDLEFQVHAARWHALVDAIEKKLTRQTPAVEFNVLRIDLFPNGDSATYTYKDVSFGPIPTNVPGRTEFVKAKLEFKTSVREVLINALP